MSIFVYKNRERIGQLQHDDSVQWLENYATPGEVKVDVLATDDNIALLVDGNRLYNTDSDTVVKIRHTDITQSEGETVLTARADITSRWLKDRVVMATENVTNVEASMYSIYSRNRRSYPIEVGTAEWYTERADQQITWGSVLEGEEKLAEVSGLGFKILFNPETAVETFKVYRGVDRSKEDSNDYVGYFGTDVGNIQNVTVTSGTTGYKNVAVVAGEGEGSARTVRIVSLGNFTGEARRELYVDARDLQREYQKATDTGEVDDKGNPIYTYETKTYTEAEYNALLDARGYEKLAEYLKDFSITCDVIQNNIFYGVDYFLGDRMPVNLPEYGIKATARISSVTMIYGKEGTKVTALLSEFELEV